jgi:hypothetical protein
VAVGAQDAGSSQASTPDASAPINGGSPPANCNPNVTIGHVIRGNPYVARNANTAAGLPDSVPPTKTYDVDVTVSNWAACCAGKQINLSVAGSGGANGTATVSPAQISGNGTFTVTVTGGNQTAPGSGGHLKIHAELDGAVKAESAGFSVCAHPINYSDAFASDINAGGVVGVAVQDGWDSDSGTLGDLKQVIPKEIVDEPPPTVPPFHNDVFRHSGYEPTQTGDTLTVDQHTISKPDKGPKADWIMPQLVVYKCLRCGCVDIPQPNSGMNIVHHVFNDGGVWKHRAEKVGAAVTIGAFSVGAGVANVKGPDHTL